MKDKRVYEIDSITGECKDVTDEMFVETLSQRKQRKEYFEKSQKDYFDKLVMNDQYIQNGHFVWYIYQTNMNCFEGINPSYITKLIYLCTFTDYQGYLSFYNQRHITKDNIKDVLKLNDKSCYSFLKTVIDKNILIPEIIDGEQRYRVNSDMFFKGQITNEIFSKLVVKDKSITRIYFNSIRNLYERTPVKSHKQLGYIYKLIPYINKEYNVVCYNPEETEWDKVKIMPLEDICKLIGYSPRNKSILIKELLKVTFEENNNTFGVIRYLIFNDNGLQAQTFINPRICYAGKNKENVTVLRGVSFSNSDTHTLSSTNLKKIISFMDKTINDYGGYIYGSRLKKDLSKNKTSNGFFDLLELCGYKGKKTTSLSGVNEVNRFLEININNSTLQKYSVSNLGEKIIDKKRTSKYLFVSKIS